MLMGDVIIRVFVVGLKKAEQDPGQRTKGIANNNLNQENGCEERSEFVG